MKENEKNAPAVQETPHKKKTNEELYRAQVKLLDTFLAHGAITKEQYNKSYRDLTEKMGFGKEGD